MGLALLLIVVTVLSIWVYCLMQILAGNALETFQLGNVVTSNTALGASYLMVFIGDTLVFIAIAWSAFAHYRNRRREEEFVAKYRKQGATGDDDQISWRKRWFPNNRRS